MAPNQSLEDVTMSREAGRSGTLRRLRQELGISQSELAAAVGCSPSAVSLIERGLTRPRAQTAARLVSVLASAVAASELGR